MPHFRVDSAGDGEKELIYPPEQQLRKTCDTKQEFGAGETYDYEFRREKAGRLVLQAEFINLKTVLPVEVVEGTEISRKLAYPLSSAVAEECRCTQALLAFSKCH